MPPLPLIPPQTPTPAGRFYPRGIRSQDSLGHPAAHAQQVIVRRDHRARRRAGEEPSPTPLTSDLLPQSSSLQPTSGSQPSSALFPLAHENLECFICERCSIARPLGYSTPMAYASTALAALMTTTTMMKKNSRCAFGARKSSADRSSSHQVVKSSHIARPAAHSLRQNHHHKSSRLHHRYLKAALAACLLRI
jgi:hypothetical protein